MSRSWVTGSSRPVVAICLAVVGDQLRVHEIERGEVGLAWSRLIE